MEAFIDPKSLAKIKDMALVARTVAEGFLNGTQSSRQRGVGIEFNQYRAYEPGDDLSRIDWKLFARSDKYFVREAERESEIEIWFLLDASHSMSLRSQYREQKADHWHKLDYAKHLIASLTYLAQKQGDAIGYMGMTDKDPTFLQSGTGDKHWHRLLQALSDTKFGRAFPNLELLKHHLERLQKPALIFVISDFYERQAEITNFVSQLNSMRSEVVAMQAICQEEIDFNYRGAVRFQDLETGELVLVSAKRAKPYYLAAFKNQDEKLKEILLKKRINHYRFSIDEPLDHVLFEYLKHRERIGL